MKSVSSVWKASHAAPQRHSLEHVPSYTGMTVVLTVLFFTVPVPDLSVKLLASVGITPIC